MELIHLKKITLFDIYFYMSDILIFKEMFIKNLLSG